MLRIKFWLLLFSVILIMLNKFSFLGKIRDTISIFIEESTSFIQNKVTTYPKLLILDTNKQTKLEIENSKLKKQVEEYALLVKEEHNQKIAEENLAKLDTRNNPEFISIIARATIDINYLVNNKLLINKGAVDNIHLGNTVINKDGVIGQISSVNAGNSQVTLITHNDFKIYLEDKRFKSKMLATGIGNNNLLVKYIDKNFKITIGDILVTTGLDDLYPANIPVARVIKIFNEENGFNSALCVPIVNFNQLQFIVVLRKKP